MLGHMRIPTRGVGTGKERRGIKKLPVSMQCWNGIKQDAEKRQAGSGHVSEYRI